MEARVLERRRGDQKLAGQRIGDRRSILGRRGDRSRQGSHAKKQ